MRKKDYVDTKEAASSLGINVSAVHKMIEAGIVRPVRGPRIDGNPVNLYRRLDIQQIITKRAAFKEECMARGRTTRFGRRHRRSLKDGIDAIP